MKRKEAVVRPRCNTSFHAPAPSQSTQKNLYYTIITLRVGVVMVVQVLHVLFVQLFKMQAGKCFAIETPDHGESHFQNYQRRPNL